MTEKIRINYPYSPQELVHTLKSLENTQSSLEADSYFESLYVVLSNLPMDTYIMFAQDDDSIVRPIKWEI
jgi:hypothetical protein